MGAFVDLFFSIYRLMLLMDIVTRFLPALQQQTLVTELVKYTTPYFELFYNALPELTNVTFNLFMKQYTFDLTIFVALISLSLFQQLIRWVI